TVGGSAIDVDLRAGAGRTGLTGVPVVVLFAHALDALDGQARDLLPQGGGFVVGVVDGDPDVLLCEGEAAVGLAGGQQLPGIADRALFEVVAEGPVAHHL